MRGRQLKSKAALNYHDRDTGIQIKDFEKTQKYLKIKNIVLLFAIFIDRSLDPRVSAAKENYS